MIERKIVFVTTNEQLTELITFLLKKKKSIALDFECEFNLHRYGMHLCLIQLYDGKKCYLIDPLQIKNMQLIRELFQSNLEKIMFAAKGDLCLLDHVYKIHMKNIFDIQVAARLLEYPSLSLSGVIRHLLKIETSKSKSKQKANWMIRPLSENLIEYASDDVIHLIKIRKICFKQLKKKKMLPAFALENEELEHSRFKPQKNPHLKIKNASSLDNRQRKFLKAFYKIRDELARKLDMSPHFLLSNQALIEISRRRPSNRRSWLSLRGLNKKAHPFINRFVQAEQKLDQK